jgi:hypothetical protein
MWRRFVMIDLTSPPHNCAVPSALRLDTPVATAPRCHATFSLLLRDLTMSSCESPGNSSQGSMIFSSRTALEFSTLDDTPWLSIYLNLQHCDTADKVESGKAPASLVATVASATALRNALAASTILQSIGISSLRTLCTP